MTMKNTHLIAVFFVAFSVRIWRAWRNAKMSSIFLPLVYGNVLDLGCNDGWFTSQLLEQSTKIDSIYGIDSYLPKTTYIPAQPYDGVNIPFPDKDFDVVVCSFMLHHAQDAAQVLREAKRVGERVVILEDYVDTWLARWTTFMTHDLVTPLFPFMAYQQFRTVAEWEAMFQQTGLKMLAKHEYTSTAPYAPFLRHIVFVVADDQDGEELQKSVQLYTPGIDRIDVFNIIFSVAIVYLMMSLCVSWLRNAKPADKQVEKVLDSNNVNSTGTVKE